MVEINAQHPAQQVVEGLAGVPGVGVVGSVAGRYVEHPVGPEAHSAAVMPAGTPLEQNLLGTGHQSSRAVAPDVETRQAIGPLGLACSPIREDQHLPVGGMARVEGHAVDQPPGDLQERLRSGGPAVLRHLGDSDDAGGALSLAALQHH